MAYTARTRDRSEQPVPTRADEPAGRYAGRMRATTVRRSGSWPYSLARGVHLVSGVIALLIVFAIVLRLLGANPFNTAVSDVHDAAAWFVGPFKDVFVIRQPKMAITVNWGLAAVVYLVVGSLIARLVADLGPRTVTTTSESATTGPVA
jgi:hypothetical protein